MDRYSTAVWQGSGKNGSGKLNSQSKTLDNTPYSYPTRFENEPGTNPEELIAAAHAGCFTMQLTFNIDEAGFEASEINTKCTITLEDGAISKSHLVVEATVPRIDQVKFEQLVAHAEKNCPVSKLLQTEISVESRLL